MKKVIQKTAPERIILCFSSESMQTNFSVEICHETKEILSVSADIVNEEQLKSEMVQEEALIFAFNLGKIINEIV